MTTRKINGCLNCGRTLGSPAKTFQGILICDDCYKIVSHYIQRTKNEMSMLYLVYVDMLRVALVKGELRPPKAVPGNEEMHPLELTQAFKRMAEKFGGLHGKATEGSNGKLAVSDVRTDESDSDGEVRGG